MVRDIGEFRSGFYSEFRRARREHSGLAWGAFPGKMTNFKKYKLFEHGHVQNIKNFIFFCGIKAPQGAARHKGVFQDL